MENVWAIIVTVVSGVFLYLISEYLREVWLETFQNYKKVKSDIAFSLVYYALYYSNPHDMNNNTTLHEEYKNVSIHFRDLASKLWACGELRYRINPGIPKAERIFDAAKQLIGLSNSLFSYGNSDRTISNNEKRVEIIREKLMISKEKT